MWALKSTEFDQNKFQTILNALNHQSNQLIATNIAIDITRLAQNRRINCECVYVCVRARAL